MPNQSHHDPNHGHNRAAEPRKFAEEMDDADTKAAMRRLVKECAAKATPSLLGSNERISVLPGRIVHVAPVGTWTSAFGRCSNSCIEGFFSGIAWPFFGHRKFSKAQK